MYGRLSPIVAEEVVPYAVIAVVTILFPLAITLPFGEPQLVALTCLPGTLTILGGIMMQLIAYVRGK